MPFFSPKGEPLQNPYELLKLEHGVNDDEISKAFKKLMLQLHPDKQPVGQSDEEADAVARLMHDVMDAKAFLLDAATCAEADEGPYSLASDEGPDSLASDEGPCSFAPDKGPSCAASTLNGHWNSCVFHLKSKIR